MEQLYFLSLLFLFNIVAMAQDRVLVFTKTNEFRHSSIDEGIAMITNLGVENELWIAEATEDPADFTEANLSRFKAVVWCNTSGDGLLNEEQQNAFETYIQNGGGFVGIHAATDTYRDGSWEFYNELVGAIVQTNPNHTTSNYNATMTVVNDHPSVEFLGNSWNKNEEYYYWKINGGYLYPNNINLLEVESTGNQDYDEPRPISWYKEYGGGRSFYTALGHNDADYTNDDNFIKHVEEGIKYAMGITLGFNGSDGFGQPRFYPNPVEDVLNINLDYMGSVWPRITVYDLRGRIVFSRSPMQHEITIDTSNWKSGMYIMEVVSESSHNHFQIIKR